MKNVFAPGLAGLAMLATTLPGIAAEAPATYATPQDALEALMTALAAPGQDAVLEVFGSGAQDLLSTGNPERDAGNRQSLLELWAEGYRFQPSEAQTIVLLGSSGWPFPIPLARSDAAWTFDIDAGRDEVYFRRIGLNELETIEMMAAYVDIQSAFRLTDHDGDGVMEFAASILSSDGARDGLVWADDDSPLGARIALASLDGYSTDQGDQDPEPFGGYYYRILQGQAASAPGGAMDYVIGDNMVAGHALLAVPAEYGQSGIHSFMASENGTVLEADLGEDSLTVAYGITRFDPGADWTPTQ
ncbi:MAG: hypothetical protein ACI8R4_001128 [Paracoccaceae bacterium]|jgi:hypothetical protein